MHPDAVVVKDLNEDIGAESERDAGVEKVAGVDDDRRATALGLKRAEGRQEVFDGAVALEKMHVLGASEVALERSGEDDDGDVRAAAAEVGGDLGPELPGAEMIIEDRDIDIVKDLGCLLNGGGRDALIAVLAKDGSAEMQVGRLVVQKEDTNVLSLCRHTPADVGWFGHG
jgi:hypothetical protein